MKVIALIAQGDKVYQACEKEGVGYSTFFTWKSEDQFLQDAYARAREDRADRYFEETVEIADALPSVGFWEDKDGKRLSEREYDALDREERDLRKFFWVGLTSEQINHAKLQIDARKWYLSKLMPKQYGDKVALEQSGPNGGPIQHAVDVSKLPDDLVDAVAKLLDERKTKSIDS